MILSSCQRLGLAPSPEWLDTLASAFLSTIDTQDKVAMMRTDNFIKPLVGLAGLGWKPSAEQWVLLADAAQQQLPMGYFRARALLETAWAFAQFGQQVSPTWSQVGLIQGFVGGRVVGCCIGGRGVWVVGFLLKVTGCELSQVCEED